MHIAICKTENYEYPKPETLFRPDRAYPEYPFDEISEKNAVYDQVRETFHLLKMDEENYGKSSWNPLGEVVKPGDCVLIKPNLVMEANAVRENGTDCLYTNPAVTAAVIDYVSIALQGKGKIVVGDAPMQECRFDVLLKESGYGDLIQWYKSRGLDIEIADFRELTSEVVNGLRVQRVRKGAAGTVVDLGEDSEFAGLDEAVYERLRITNYDPDLLKQHHSRSKNEYFISSYVLNADVIINMPKPKSHRKAGATIALKNFVGINVRKEFLPHHTFGSADEGGDEYLEKDLMHSLSSAFLDKQNKAVYAGRRLKAHIYRTLRRAATVLSKKDNFREGSWYGNNTISRTLLDLNKIVLYADKNGKMQDEVQRKLFIVADMIISGEKEGPVAPSPKKTGIIAAGGNQVCFDEAVAALMGYDVNKIPSIKNARRPHGKYVLCDDSTRPEVISNVTHLESLMFEPTSGWKGHIEA